MLEADFKMIPPRRGVLHQHISSKQNLQNDHYQLKYFIGVKIDKIRKKVFCTYLYQVGQPHPSISNCIFIFWIRITASALTSITLTSPMSTNVDTSQSLILTTSACFDIQELRSRSQASDDSFEEFLPAIEVMPICAQLSKKKKKNAFANTENRRARYALVPAVFGVDGSSPPRVTSWRFK